MYASLFGNTIDSSSALSSSVFPPSPDPIETSNMPFPPSTPKVRHPVFPFSYTPPLPLPLAFPFPFSSVTTPVHRRNSFPTSDPCSSLPSSPALKTGEVCSMATCRGQFLRANPNPNPNPHPDPHPKPSICRPSPHLHTSTPPHRNRQSTPHQTIRHRSGGEYTDIVTDRHEQ
ncbi:hypothetical protein BO70DRAFT_178931 [Aspergillus heteromorphus CBS 117.55]|uniref:Uncharacterized protein n=1 Tax=Aspergillus heteromorphus CBS 117.55 TaxID=1448321 RepID=A0A317WVL1_9EURO|nr:uncharacterized protein BO70DRAFT_178931 [Aspergillus heteromorphus CBS 117.55]PWY88310.1 hypothetical protein BO70DRAFT_178931 [Aspergillus heteromorphus CBS 117.55]